MYSPANTDEIESLLICTYNERSRSEEAYDNLMILVRLWWGISIRVKIIIQGLYHWRSFKSWYFFTFAIAFDLEGLEMKNFVLYF